MIRALQLRHRDSVDVLVEGGNPLPPLFKAVPDEPVLRQGCLGEDLGLHGHTDCSRSSGNLISS